MAKVTIYLPDELAERVRASGISMSPVCQRALQEEVERMQATAEMKAREERIVVEVGGPGETLIDKAFYGTWLVAPDEDQSRTAEEYYDRGTYWGVALTRLGQIAVYTRHCNDLRQPDLIVFADLEDAADAVPPDILAAAAHELGQPRPIELDI
ncbi:MAG TPA: type II toxin-antitoxin system CcdA family antitoxin [Acidimicrobiales bacterium]|nr:type II toxin-antitoxin system CcdA family antitoxin [Acidimicrobiales bacterium]